MTIPWPQTLPSQITIGILQDHLLRSGYLGGFFSSPSEEALFSAI